VQLPAYIEIIRPVDKQLSRQTDKLTVCLINPPILLTLLLCPDSFVAFRLVQLRAYIEKIRPIDKQLSYQIDKLLRATSVAQSQAAADAAAGAADGDEAAAAGEDALRYRPNPQALIAKAPLLGDAEGEQQLGACRITYRSTLCPAM
jgi:hypothetical protein